MAKIKGRGRRVPEPSYGPIRPRPEYAELLDRAALEGYSLGRKCVRCNPYISDTPEWHRFEAGYFLGYEHMKESNREAGGIGGEHPLGRGDGDGT